MPRGFRSALLRSCFHHTTMQPPMHPRASRHALLAGFLGWTLDAFGLLADRFGRRAPLMANVIYFSIIELLSGCSQTFTQFIILRALFGIGMGGEWGVGASLALENVPRKWRGVLSGMLQSGYSIGFLLASAASRTVLPHFGWRWMFWIGALPALLALYI